MNQIQTVREAIDDITLATIPDQVFRFQFIFLYSVIERITREGYVPDEAFKKIVEQARMETLAE